MQVVAPATIIFTIFFIVFTISFVFQFKEFSAIGLSPENLLSSVLISEELRFVHHHMIKTSGTIVIHSLLPAVFLVGYTYFTIFVDGNYESTTEFFDNWPIVKVAFTLSLVVSLAVAALAYRWQLGDRSGHPFAEKFRPYLTAALPLWSDVAKDINTEFRRIDKFSIRVNPLQKVVVTDNWIVMVGQWPWKFHLAHQSDVTLDLLSSEHHQISTEGQAGGTQYLTIEVKNRRLNAESFRFRLNSLEYQNLQDKLQGPIENIRNIQIFKTVSERFVEVFREEVARNPRSQSDAELEPCIGCMVSTANVVLVRRCDPESAREGEAACVNCHCRPMWCLDCLGKWFASRQNQRDTETWLSSKCPCPTCRSKFCILDVSLIG